MESSLLSLRITFICFTLVFILALAEGVFLAMPDEPTARVGHVAVFLATLLPGMIVGLLAGSGRRGFSNALVAGLPALIIVLLLAGIDHTLRFYTPFREVLAPPLDQFVFRAVMFGLLLVISAAVGRFVTGEAVAGPEVIKVREVGPLEDVEEVEKRIEEEVQKEKLSGVQLVEEPEERREVEPSAEEAVVAPPPSERPVETKLCLSCGAEVPSAAVYCPSCGRRLEQQR